ncbi:DUF421 domain-containing protein [Alkaliphilus hydrothermalis]|uniref:Uncharacterized membrane protein YcaP (DUF421 family) n=1 Tax=Alkaliphilus hydrothermalis TaxID=1482730 RepID=A0ABS2NL55_9FIRM|nr:DUF421 domain-containing protein [Alkaliphilus hydrothermalis]MBM7613611.1 uncharacterized membrane protein YcaP (DUF421 family) [Alkaliphilus hydrothermalis]
MNVYLLVFLRIISIMSLLLFMVLLVMGKRPIGELPVFDFLTIVVIGAVVGADIADPSIKHLPTAFAIVVLALLQKIISTLSIKSKRVKKLINFEPTIVAVGGELHYKNIKKIDYTVDEILMLLREKDIFDLNRVGYAIIEQNGNLSVLRKSQEEPLTPKQMNIYTPESSLHTTVISEGKLQRNNLNSTTFTEEYIQAGIKEKGYKSIEEVFFASIDRNGLMNISGYVEKEVVIS